MPDPKGPPLKLGTPQGWDGGLPGVGRESEACYHVRSAPSTPSSGMERHSTAPSAPLTAGRDPVCSPLAPGPCPPLLFSATDGHTSQGGHGASHVPAAR